MDDRQKLVATICANNPGVEPAQIEAAVDEAAQLVKSLEREFRAGVFDWSAIIQLLMPIILQLIQKWFAKAVPGPAPEPNGGFPILK